MSPSTSSRRQVLARVAVTLGFDWSLGTAFAASSNTRIIVPFAPGGSVDLTARAVGARLATALGENFIVENKPGASGQVGVQTVVESVPDGHTLLVATSGVISIAAHLRKLPYDTTKDLTPVVMFANAPAALAVHHSSSINSVAELLKEAKARPQGLSYSAGALGTHMHLAGELLRRQTGANLVPVTYRGAAPGAMAIASGEVEAGISDLSSLMPLATNKQIRILAVIGAKRTVVAPDIPTIAESGVPGYRADAWIGMFAPVGTPAAVVERISKEVIRVLQTPAVRETFLKASLEPAPMSSEDLRKVVIEDSQRWGKVVRDANIKLD